MSAWFILPWNSSFVQVVELHTKLRALSAVARQQAEELAVWRLTSQPPPAFDLSNTDKRDQREEGLTPGVLENHCKVTLARTDELVLSCSSNKLQGCMLNYR